MKIYYQLYYQHWKKTWSYKLTMQCCVIRYSMARHSASDRFLPRVSCSWVIFIDIGDYVDTIEDKKENVLWAKWPWLDKWVGKNGEKREGRERNRERKKNQTEKRSSLLHKVNWEWSMSIYLPCGALSMAERREQSRRDVRWDEVLHDAMESESGFKKMNQSSKYLNSLRCPRASIKGLCDSENSIGQKSNKKNKRRIR